MHKLTLRKTPGWVIRGWFWWLVLQLPRLIAWKATHPGAVLCWIHGHRERRFVEMTSLWLVFECPRCRAMMCEFHDS